MYAIRSYYAILTETTFTVLDNSVNPQIICQVVQLSDKQKQNKLFFETDDYLKKVTEGTNEVIFRLRVLPRTIFRITSYNVCYTKLLRKR